MWIKVYASAASVLPAPTTIPWTTNIRFAKPSKTAAALSMEKRTSLRKPCWLWCCCLISKHSPTATNALHVSPAMPSSSPTSIAPSPSVQWIPWTIRRPCLSSMSRTTSLLSRRYSSTNLLSPFRPTFK